MRFDELVAVVRTWAPQRADLRGLARRRLAAAGVTAVSASAHCTHDEPGRFFSHRRDGPCGRMATLVWLAG